MTEENMKTYKFKINHPGEMEAGIWGYSDDVTVIVDSGNPGGESGEFAEYIADCLAIWFDGANVTISND